MVNFLGYYFKGILLVKFFICMDTCIDIIVITVDESMHKYNFICITQHTDYCFLSLRVLKFMLMPINNKYKTTHLKIFQEVLSSLQITFSPPGRASWVQWSSYS